MKEGSKMTEHVPDQKRCQRLKELGMPQETVFTLFSYEKPCMDSLGNTYFTEVWEISERKGLRICNELVAAPLATEMLEWLPMDGPRWIKLDIYRGRGDKTMCLYYTVDFDTVQFNADTLPNALADLLIWCVEQGYVRFEECKP